MVKTYFSPSYPVKGMATIGFTHCGSCQSREKGECSTCDNNRAEFMEPCPRCKTDDVYRPHSFHGLAICVGCSDKFCTNCAYESSGSCTYFQSMMTDGLMEIKWKKAEKRLITNPEIDSMVVYEDSVYRHRIVRNGDGFLRLHEKL